jgi:hypothetical protein
MLSVLLSGCTLSSSSPPFLLYHSHSTCIIDCLHHRDSFSFNTKVKEPKRKEDEGTQIKERGCQGLRKCQESDEVKKSVKQRKEHFFFGSCFCFIRSSCELFILWKRQCCLKSKEFIFSCSVSTCDLLSDVEFVCLPKAILFSCLGYFLSEKQGGRKVHRIELWFKVFF